MGEVQPSVLNTHNPYGYSMLHYASKSNFQHCPCDMSIKNILALNKRNETPIHIAAKNGARNILDLMIKKLMECPEQISNIVDEDGMSLFHVICISEDLAYVSTFLKKDPSIDVNQMISKDSEFFAGYTALHFAAYYGRAITIKLLIDRGADPKAITTSGLTMLHLVCAPNKWDWMIYEADTMTLQEVLDAEGALALHAKFWCSQICKFLGEALEARLSIVKHLLDVGVYVDAKDKTGKSALMLIALHEKDRYCLHDYFNTSTFLTYIIGTTLRLPFLEKIFKLFDDYTSLIVNTLLERYVKEKSVTLEQSFSLVNASGSTYFHYLAKQRYFDEKVIAVFLRSGVNGNVVDNNFLTPLHTAIKESNAPLRNLLLNLEESYLEGLANVNAQDALGNTPLHYFITRDKAPKSVENIALLLHYGVDVNIENKSGLTGFSIIHAYICNNIISGNKFKRMATSYNDVNIFKHKAERCLFRGNCNFSFVLISQMISIWKSFMKLKLYYNYTNVEHEEFINLLTKILLRKPNIHEASNEFIAECKQEVSKMKETRFSFQVTLYDMMVKNINRVASYTENTELKQFLKSPDLRIQFPIYEEMLKARFVRGLARKKLLSVAVDSFTSIIDENVPLLCVDIIFSYLNEKHLRDIIVASGKYEQSELARQLTSTIEAK